ncbi:MAG: glycosyltransferase family 4 protein [Myxococcota bacterium]
MTEFSKPPGRDNSAGGLNSLFLMPWGTNEGYAIDPLLDAFFLLGLELGGGDQDRVHFGFPHFDRGAPRSLPEDFSNLLAFDTADTSASNIEKLSKEARERQIGLVFCFDVQPVHPLFRSLRLAGVEAIVSYWGAPISSPQGPLRLALKRAEMRLSRSRVDGLIFESNAMAELARVGRGVPESMIDIVPTGVDTDYFKPRETPADTGMIGVPNDKKAVVYAGHMEERKGVPLLVDAAIELLEHRSVDDVRFLICGNRPGEVDHLERKIEAAGQQERIRFGGYRNDLNEVFAHAYCGVIPSSGWDSFPRSPIEMAACGLPVVASRLQGIEDSVVEGETGLFFEPGDRAGLVRRLEEMLDDPEGAERLGRQARERCLREYSNERVHENLLNAVRRHLGGGRRGLPGTKA